MLWRIGTMEEYHHLNARLPEKAAVELIRDIAVLDYEYGPKRDYLQSGGYTLIADSEEELAQIKEIVDYEEHPCEWVLSLGEYLSALYLLNDDFSIVVFLPKSIAPEVILKELEEEKQ